MDTVVISCSKVGGSSLPLQAFDATKASHQRGAGRISPYTRPHSKNAETGGFLFLDFDVNFDFKIIKLLYRRLISNQQVQNRGRFLFTFPHPSWNGTSVCINSPWASKSAPHDTKCWKLYTSKRDSRVGGKVTT